MTIKTVGRSSRTKQLFQFLTILFAGILLSSCFPILSSDTELTLKSGEKWALNNEIVVSPETVSMYGGDLAEIFNDMVVDLGELGIDAEWEIKKPDKENNIPYALTTKGTSYESFNQAFERNALRADPENKDIVYFHLTSDMEYAYDALQSRFTLKGRKILSSNGNQTNKGTVEWVNHSGSLDATLKPGSSSGGTIFFLLFLAVAAVGFFWFSRPDNPYKQRILSRLYDYFPNTGAPPQNQQQTRQFCPRCGNKLPPGAGFCPQCGERFIQ